MILIQIVCFNSPYSSPVLIHGYHPPFIVYHKYSHTSSVSCLKYADILFLGLTAVFTPEPLIRAAPSLKPALYAALISAAAVSEEHSSQTIHHHNSPKTLPCSVHIMTTPVILISCVDDLEISKAADHDHERDPRDEDQECGYPGLYAVCLRKACKTDTYAREKVNDKAAHRVCFQITIQFVSRKHTRWAFFIYPGKVHFARMDPPKMNFIPR